MGDDPHPIQTTFYSLRRLVTSCKRALDSFSPFAKSFRMIDHVIGDSDSTTDETYSIDLCTPCSAKKEDGAVVGYILAFDL